MREAIHALKYDRIHPAGRPLGVRGAGVVSHPAAVRGEMLLLVDDILTT